MKNRNSPRSSFNLRALILAAIPAYLFPVLMAFTSGYFLQKKELMTASYTTIGLSSLLSTICSFMILWLLETRQIMVQKKMTRSILIILSMIGLGICFASIFQLQSECFNITFSAFLGATILTIRQKVKNYPDDKN